MKGWSTSNVTVIDRMKRCTKCLHWKPLDGFYVKNSAKGRLQPRCKACHDADAKEYRDRNREAYRAYQREYIKRDEVRVARADSERLRRFRKRMARKRGA